jgi:murein DD-endopeptidase MepM/ murein hydrolase activator NlpD
MPVAASTRRGRRWIAAALVSITVPIVVFSGAVDPASAQTDDQKLSQLQQDAASAASDIGVRDAAAEKAAAALATIRTQLAAANATLTSANRDLGAAQRVLTTKRNSLAKAQDGERIAQEAVSAASVKYNAARDQLRVMLRATYEEGVGGDLDALMEGGTPDDLADRVGLLDRLSATRQSRLGDLATARDALTRKQSELGAARAKAQNAVLSADQQFRAVGALQSRRAAASGELASLQSKQEKALKTAQASAAKAKVKYTQLQASSARLEGILAARAAAEAGSSGLPLSTGDGAESSGGLVMPAVGTFSSGFGYRVDPFGLGTTFHAGQDIAAPTGTPIIAATAGTVAIVETPAQSGGYGNYTCIDRGAGFATCYAHQSAVFVHVGQVVTQSQLIGLVGSTGASTGPHLHFEVRLNGVPVDPVPYLP